MSEKKLSVIWNVTAKCPWSCTFCCMDCGPDNCQAEMTREQKFSVADQLGAIDCRVDLSGGEVMLNRKDHLPLIRRLSGILGRENLGISCSGIFIDEEIAGALAPLVADVEMTMDTNPERDFFWRQKAYHRAAAKAALALLRRGVSTGLQTVVTVEHRTPGLLEDLYGWLCRTGVDNWSILKFFPSGRGSAYPQLELSDEDCKTMVERIRTIDAANHAVHKPVVDFHYLMPGTEKSSACRCVKRSIGILPDGRVTACFWGLDSSLRFIDDKFYLGDLLKQDIQTILSGPKARYWLDYCGCCALSGAA